MRTSDLVSKFGTWYKSTQKGYGFSDLFKITATQNIPIDEMLNAPKGYRRQPKASIMSYSVFSLVFLDENLRRYVQFFIKRSNHEFRS